MKNELLLLKDVLWSNVNLNKYPYKLTFAITYRCNYRCIQCHIWKKKNKKELNIEEIEKFVKNYPYFKWINLTGGEPFLRNDISKIVEIFLKYSKHVALINTTTNGFNSEIIRKKVLEMLDLNPHLLIVVVSLDGYKELHEKIRGIPDSFNNAIKTFVELKKISEKKKNFKTFLGYTISPFNVGEFKKTYFEVKKEICDLSISHFHFNIYHTSVHYYENLELLENRRTEDYKEKLIKEINFIKSKKKANFFNPVCFLEKKYIELSEKYIKSNKTPLPCKAIQSSVFIDPIGNVFPCTIYNSSLGNLRKFDYNLKKILKKDSTKKLKKHIRLLRCPNCWTPCEAYQTILGNLISIFK